MSMEPIQMTARRSSIYRFAALSHAMFAAILALAPKTSDAAVCRAETDRAAPLLELYTSEGCSSCPPADRWLSALVASHPLTDMVALGYHVDYWDQLGWKDRFALPGNSVRQRLRARDARRNVVYTPQVMLGEQVQLDWRDAGEVQQTADTVRTTSPPLRLALSASYGGDHQLHVALDAKTLDSGLDGPRRIELALYADDLHSRVSAGENRGVALRHDRVVRRLLGPWQVHPAAPLHVDTSVALPPERGAAWGVVAILHAGDAISPRWALDLPLGECLAAAAAETGG
jgi:hypothetical protein